uniref:Uncharacterized protein n=1 Tax=Lactuca sativa TaxID=4236 RepID=A0A9R1XAZ4_LACSA|nr:hypothetical protein LSAT_V11C500234310 [Lactuca sativa]
MRYCNVVVMIIRIVDKCEQKQNLPDHHLHLGDGRGSDRGGIGRGRGGGGSGGNEGRDGSGVCGDNTRDDGGGRSIDGGNAEDRGGNDNCGVGGHKGNMRTSLSSWMIYDVNRVDVEENEKK